MAAENWMMGAHLSNTFRTASALFLPPSMENVPRMKKPLHHFALSLNMCFWVLLHPCGKLALIMSWDLVLIAAIKEGPEVPYDRTIAVLKL